MDAFLLHNSIHAAARADFARSGGPGGQNVNKLNTKVCLRVNLDDLAGLSEAEYSRLRETLGYRVTGEGEFVIHADEERSRLTNLRRAYARMEALISAAARFPKRRRPTKPSTAARERRLNSKRIQSAKKSGRRSPLHDDG
jgi:ribosome-associated protein